MAGMRIAATLGVLWCVASVATIWAQDVVVSPPTWIDPDDPPDQLPEFRSPSFEFPPELEKTADIGWAVIDLFIDDHGQLLTIGYTATQPAYERAVNGRSFSAGWRCKPARRKGEAVNARVRVSVAFNPASAGEEMTEATPRLLEAAPAVDPTAHEAYTVWARIAVDENGSVTAVNEPPEGLSEILKAAARKWRFAPARHAGRPVASEVRAPFLIVAPESPEKSVKSLIPPRVTSREDPEYPRLMHLNGVRGEVDVAFVVDIEGRVRKEHVVASTNPLFDEPALAAIRKWKFQAAQANGIPLETQVRQTFEFEIPGGGRDGFEVRRRAKLSKLPEDLRYDTAAKIESFVMPIYPFELLKADKGGWAEVTAIVNASGEVVETKVVRADKPEFGLALQAAVDRFRYLPALKNGQPIDSLIGFSQKFDAWNKQMVSTEEHAALRLEEKHPEQIAKADALDRKLKVIHAEPPTYPKSLAERPSGRAKISFLVDEKGRVRVPRILEATKDEFGYAAVQAVSAWTFEPPTSKGDGVSVRVVVPFDFNPASPNQRERQQSSESP